MAQIIAVANQKGGVGKTFLVFHLAYYLWEQGSRVLAIDLDPQGNLTLSFHLGQGKWPESCLVAEVFERETLPFEEVEKGLCLSGANIQLARYEAQASGVGVYFKLRKALAPHQETFDFVLIDCPPSLGLFSLSAFVAAEKLLVPLRAEVFSVSGLGDLVNVVQEVQENINPALEIVGLVLNAVHQRTKVARETLAELEKSQGLPVLAQIPASIKIEESLRAGKPLWRLEPGHKMAPRLKEAMAQITQALIRSS